jgi:hypothetical protein
LAWVCGELIRLGLEIVVTDKRLWIERDMFRGIETGDWYRQ